MGIEEVDHRIPTETLAVLRGILVKSLSRENLSETDLKREYIFNNNNSTQGYYYNNDYHYHHRKKNRITRDSSKSNVITVIQKERKQYQQQQQQREKHVPKQNNGKRYCFVRFYGNIFGDLMCV